LWLCVQVYDLCRYTAFSAALDTYTDSNTRERTPYEADGMIAATSRILVQRDFLYARHSHAFVLQNPTWPVEWQQLSPFLGWQDYMATGQVRSPHRPIRWRSQAPHNSDFDPSSATGIVPSH
jgi:hypothetical protein